MKRAYCTACFLLPTWTWVLYVVGRITMNVPPIVGSRRFGVPLFLKTGLILLHTIRYYLRKELERTCQVQYRKSFNSTDEADSVPERPFLFQHDPTPARANAGWSQWRERLGEPCIEITRHTILRPEETSHQTCQSLPWQTGTRPPNTLLLLNSMKVNDYNHVLLTT